MTETQNKETALISDFLADDQVTVVKTSYKHPYIWRCSGVNYERETKTTSYKIKSGGRLIIYDYSVCCNCGIFKKSCQRHRVKDFNANGGLAHTHCATERGYIPLSVRRKLDIIAACQKFGLKTPLLAQKTK